MYVRLLINSIWRNTMINGPHWIKDPCRSKDCDYYVTVTMPILSLTVQCCHWPLYSEIPSFPLNQGAHLSRGILHGHSGVQETATKGVCLLPFILNALVRKCPLSPWEMLKGCEQVWQVVYDKSILTYLSRLPSEPEESGVCHSKYALLKCRLF